MHPERIKHHPILLQVSEHKHWMVGYFQHHDCDPLTKTISAPLDPTDQCFEVKMQTWGTYFIWGSI